MAVFPTAFELCFPEQKKRKNIAWR